MSFQKVKVDRQYKKRKPEIRYLKKTLYDLFAAQGAGSVPEVCNNSGAKLLYWNLATGTVRTSFQNL